MLLQFLRLPLALYDGVALGVEGEEPDGISSARHAHASQVLGRALHLQSQASSLSFQQRIELLLAASMAFWGSSSNSLAATCCAQLDQIVGGNGGGAGAEDGSGQGKEVAISLARRVLIVLSADLLAFVPECRALVE